MKGVRVVLKRCEQVDYKTRAKEGGHRGGVLLQKRCWRSFYLVRLNECGTDAQRRVIRSEEGLDGKRAAVMRRQGERGK